MYSARAYRLVGPLAVDAVEPVGGLLVEVKRHGRGHVNPSLQTDSGKMTRSVLTVCGPNSCVHSTTCLYDTCCVDRNLDVCA